MNRTGKFVFYGLVALVLVWAVGVRTWRLGNRPFWQDEAWVALAVTSQPPGELFLQTKVPLPPLFALATKLSGQCISPPEVGFRLIPVLSGIMLLPLTYAVVRLLKAPRTMALAGTALCASSLTLVVWSRELKQYEVEAFLATLLAYLVFRLRRSPTPQPRWWMVFGVALLCAAGPWIGYGVICPMASLLAVLIVFPSSTGTRRGPLIAGVVGLAVLSISVLAVLQTAAAEQAHDPALARFWDPWYIDVTNLRSWARAGYYMATCNTMMILPLEWIGPMDQPGPKLLYCTSGLVLWLMAAVGLWRWPRRGRLDMVCWVVGPWLTAVLAATAHQCPFGAARMMVCYTPPLLIAFAAGCFHLARWVSIIALGRGGPGMVLGVLIVMVPVSYVTNVPARGSYHRWHDYPKLLEVLAEQREVGELVLVTLSAAPATRYYAGDRFEPIEYAPTAAGTLRRPGFDYERFMQIKVNSAGHRCWLVTTSETGYRDRKKLLQWLGQQGYELDLAHSGAPGGIYGAPQLFAVTRSPAPRR